MKKLVFLFICLFLGYFSFAQTEKEENPISTPDDLITYLYDAISFEAGTTPDWDDVRTLFHPDATVVLRTTRDSTRVFSVDGFIDDFIRFEAQVSKNKLSFKETILARRSTVFGDMAEILVLYEAHVPEMARPPSRGVDSFHLIKNAGNWRIISIVNDIVTEENPLPEALQK